MKYNLICLLLISIVVSLNSCSKSEIWSDHLEGDYACNCTQKYLIFEPGNPKDSTYSKYDSTISITYIKESKKVNIASFPTIDFLLSDSFSYRTYPHIDGSVASFKYLYFKEKSMKYINQKYLRYSEFNDTCICTKK